MRRVELSVEHTSIPGLLKVHIPVHGDSRGWFKENWQRAKMTALGLPDFGPVQHNIAFNASRGVTRGIHSEPWDKFVSVASGRVFAAWVDLREGDTFGTTFHLEVDPSVAVFVPRGVANSYQALEDATTYTYLVNDHWRQDASYPALDLADPTVAIPWPIPLANAQVSEKDRVNPTLQDVTPIQPLRTLILGSTGQLGHALADAFPAAHAVGKAELDITDEQALTAWPWHHYGVILNATAWTGVDAAETDEGRRGAWAANAEAVANLARLARKHRCTLVHYSTDYVFDGSRELHTESETFSPLNAYGQSKAAGDLAVSMTTPRHYILRTSWLIGEGHNFVRTMQRLALTGVSPAVVADQFGRLTFADELAKATTHLLTSGAPYGTYNVTNSGPVTSWADVARDVFELCGRNRDDVQDVTTAEYRSGKQLADRPQHSPLDLTKLQASGFTPEDAHAALARYLDDTSVE